MAQDSPLQTIAKEELTPIVRKALDNETVEVTEWQFQLLQGGTVGEVYLLEGKARSDSADLPADNRNATVPWSLILKIQRQWRRSGDPECWKREKMLYQSDLFDALPDSLRVPLCFGISERDQDEIWLWLEEAAGKTGTRMSLDEYCLAARHLAHYQGPVLGRGVSPSASVVKYTSLACEHGRELGNRSIALAPERSNNVSVRPLLHSGHGSTPLCSSGRTGTGSSTWWTAYPAWSVTATITRGICSYERMLVEMVRPQ